MMSEHGSVSIPSSECGVLVAGRQGTRPKVFAHGSLIQIALSSIDTALALGKYSGPRFQDRGLSCTLS